MSNAVGIAWVDRPPDGVARAAAPASHCAFAGLARRGEVLWAATEDIACRTARFVLGCDATEAGRTAAAAPFVESRLFSNLDAALRFVSGLRVLEPRRRVFVYFPLAEAPISPDVVVRFLHPEDAMHHLRAVMTATGERAEVRTAGAAAMCADCTAAPITTDNAVLSVGCPGSRREIPIGCDEMMLALPVRLERLTSSG